MILKLATEKTNIKYLAEALNITRKQVYKHINEEVDFNVLDKIKIWIDHTDDDVIINHLAEFCGGYFYREIKRAGSKDFRTVAKILKEFSDFIAEVSEAYLDGKVTRVELSRMQKEWAECNSLVIGMFLGIEKELSK